MSSSGRFVSVSDENGSVSGFRNKPSQRVCDIVPFDWMWYDVDFHPKPFGWTSQSIFSFVVGFWTLRSKVLELGQRGIVIVYTSDGHGTLWTCSEVSYEVFPDIGRRFVWTKRWVCKPSSPRVSSPDGSFRRCDIINVCRNDTCSSLVESILK